VFNFVPACMSSFETCIQHALQQLQAHGLFELDHDKPATIDWQQRELLRMMPTDIQDVLYGRLPGASDQQYWHATAALNAVAYHLRGQHDLIRAATDSKQQAKVAAPTQLPRKKVVLDAFSYKAREALPGMLPVPGAVDDTLLTPPKHTRTEPVQL
jgi:hypothetical protein